MMNSSGDAELVVCAHHHLSVVEGEDEGTHSSVDYLRVLRHSEHDALCDCEHCQEDEVEWKAHPQ